MKNNTLSRQPAVPRMLHAKARVPAEPRRPRPQVLRPEAPPAEASMIRIGFWDILYYNCNKEPLN